MLTSSFGYPRVANKTAQVIAKAGRAGRRVEQKEIQPLCSCAVPTSAALLFIFYFVFIHRQRADVSHTRWRRCQTQRRHKAHDCCCAEPVVCECVLPTWGFIVYCSYNVCVMTPGLCLIPARKDPELLNTKCLQTCGTCYLPLKWNRWESLRAFSCKCFSSCFSNTEAVCLCRSTNTPTWPSTLFTALWHSKTHLSCVLCSSLIISQWQRAAGQYAFSLVHWRIKLLLLPVSCGTFKFGLLNFACLFAAFHPYIC